MLNVSLAVSHLYGKFLFTWLSLVIPFFFFFFFFLFCFFLCVQSCFPRDVLDEIWDLIVSVSKVFSTSFF